MSQVGPHGRLEWYADRVARITTVIPEQAHNLASAEAAGIAARKIESKATGSLAREVSRPKRIGFMHTLIGSFKRYARIENFGGEIEAQEGKRLLIRGNRIGAAGQETRSTTGGKITASAVSVTHKGKHYLEAGLAAWDVLFRAHLRRMMPK